MKGVMRISSWNEYWRKRGLKRMVVEFARKKWFNPIFAREIKNLHPKSVLEIGCGTGIMRESLPGIKYVGCDMVDSFGADKVVDVLDTPWPFKDKEFDLCYSQGLMEHFARKDQDIIIEEMKRVSRASLTLVPSAVSPLRWLGIKKVFFGQEHKNITGIYECYTKKKLKRIFERHYNHVHTFYIKQCFGITVACYAKE